MTQRRISAHWPDYFRYDCAVGTDRVAPLADAVDTVALAAADEGLRQAYAVRPDHWPEASVRRALDAMGFPSAVLTADEARRLYELRGDLLAARGSLGAVRRLAKIYLGVVEVTRGAATMALPLPAAGAERLVVADVPSSEVTLLVRPAAAATEERIAAFVEACGVLVPDGTRVRVYPPRQVVAPERRGFGTAPAPLQGRRI